MDAGSPSRQSQVSDGMEALAKSVAEINEKVLRLKDRLSRVLTSEKPTGKSEGSSSTDLCPLAVTLRELYKGMSDAINGLDDILGRIEL